MGRDFLDQAGDDIREFRFRIFINDGVRESLGQILEIFTLSQ